MIGDEVSAEISRLETVANKKTVQDQEKTRGG